jgi:hypothetical protein
MRVRSPNVGRKIEFELADGKHRDVIWIEAVVEEWDEWA